MKKTLKNLLSLTLAFAVVFSLGTAAFAAAPLSAVRNLQAYAIDDDEINLKWKEVQGADGYSVFLYDGVKWRGIGSTRRTSFEADDLQSAKQYKFRVRAYTLNGSKRVYGKYSSVLVAATEPDEVENVRASAKTKNSVTLKWSPVKNARGYQVYLYNSATKKYERKAVVSKNTAVVKNLKAGTSYVFRVRAYFKAADTYYYGELSDAFKVKTASASAVKTSATEPVKASLIGASKAGSVALSHAGLAKSQVRDFECELDNERGVKVYEVSFDYGRYDYEYEIDAVSGKILRSEKERD